MGTPCPPGWGRESSNLSLLQLRGRGVQLRCLCGTTVVIQDGCPAPLKRGLRGVPRHPPTEGLSTLGKEKARHALCIPTRESVILFPGSQGDLTLPLSPRKQRAGGCEVPEGERRSEPWPGPQRDGVGGGRTGPWAYLELCLEGSLRSKACSNKSLLLLPALCTGRRQTPGSPSCGPGIQRVARPGGQGPTPSPGALRQAQGMRCPSVPWGGRGIGQPRRGENAVGGIDSLPRPPGRLSRSGRETYPPGDTRRPQRALCWSRGEKLWASSGFLGSSSSALPVRALG